MLEQHIKNLLTPSTPFFFNTLYDPYREGTDFVRGYPFSLREGVTTATSHGLWMNIPDYDAPTQASHFNGARATGACAPVRTRAALEPFLERCARHLYPTDGQAQGAQHALRGHGDDHPQGHAVPHVRHEPGV